MNIVHFSDSYHPFLNGVTVAVEQFAEKAAEQGHNVLLFVPSFTFRSSITKVGNLTIIKVRSIPFPVYPGIHAALPNIPKLYRMLKEFKPDVIHIHTPFVLGILGTIFSQILGVKLVGTFHTLFTQQVMNMSAKRLILGKQVIAEDSERGIIPLVLWRLQIIFFNICDLVIAPTNVIFTMIKKHGIKSPIAILPSGIEIDKFPAKKSYTSTLRVLHLGRLGFEKSTEVLIDAFSLVVKEVPEAKLIIAGDGPARWGLKQYAKKLKISKSIEFMGRVPSGETPPVYASCDIFATASTFETQGIVLIEAMLTGLPIVAAKVNAPVELIKHGETGYLFDEGDSKQCAAYLIELLKDPKKVEKMGRLIRKDGECYDSSLLSEQLVGQYKELLTNRP